MVFLVSECGMDYEKGQNLPETVQFLFPWLNIYWNSYGAAG
jgi:hypothetical protein